MIAGIITLPVTAVGVIVWLAIVRPGAYAAIYGSLLSFVSALFAIAVAYDLGGANTFAAIEGSVSPSKLAIAHLAADRLQMPMPLLLSGQVMILVGLWLLRQIGKPLERQTR